MSAPTLINLPPPPSDPVTPSDIPGTPNSTTTSMSELSTVAIKDGHRGHPHHHSHPRLPNTQPEGPSASNTLDAERADRISRLAGLERVTAVRNASNASLPGGASASTPLGSVTAGYFDGTSVPAHLIKERSTVGSASATGSVGGRTTWASGSNSEHADTTDKMSEDQDMHDMDTSSVGGFSDEGNASLVGFGEGASSTVSGPISSAPGSRTPQRGSGMFGGSKGSNPPPTIREPSTPTATTTKDARMVDASASRRGMTGIETAESIMNDSFSSNHNVSVRELGDGLKGLGRFGFETDK